MKDASTDDARVVHRTSASSARARAHRATPRRRAPARAERVVAFSDNGYVARVTTADDTRRPALVPWSTAATVAVCIAAAVALSVFGGRGQYVHESLHATIETMGGCIALGMAALLLVRWQESEAPAHFEWIGTALITMGLLDIAHACLGPSPAFFWSRALPTLLGGAFFALVWVRPPSRERVLVWHRLPLVVAVATLPLCVALLAVPDAWPRAFAADGTYAWWAKALNAVGGALFLVATAFFLVRRRRAEGGAEDLVFANHTALFAVAGFSFALSHLWGPVWWLLHALRLAAYVVVLRYVVHVHRRSQAQQDLRRQAEFERRLIGIVGHDLRNPLHSILLTSEQLLRGDVQPPVARGLQRIAHGVERMNRMVVDLLDYSRTRLSGAIPVRRDAVDLDALLASVREDYEVSHPGRVRVDTTTRAGDGAWDRDRLHQLVANLVDNALKHGSDAAPVVLRGSGDAAAVTIEVRNEGPPIPAELMPHVFEPFRRGAVDGAKDSFGLGLYIVREIARAHGGAVAVASSSPGTTFTVVLPRGPSAA